MWKFQQIENRVILDKFRMSLDQDAAIPDFSKVMHKVTYFLSEMFFYF